ncbi:MAG: murein L,D-transpeptidase catalytic domain family protein, partial [Bacteroidia bacterium]|nr:murein L,D-transpeptidase catalytic domain family protein [Bacteroidia bacterium]
MEKKRFTKKQRLDEFLKWKISDKLISVEAVFLATRIWEKLPPTKSDSFFLVDFSKPSTEKRLFLLSMDSKKVIWSDFVAHGKGSGELYAKNFSNENESHCTSIGLFQTAEHYNGKYGISVR